VAAGGARRATAQVPELRHDIETALATARTALSESAFAKAWAEGRALSLEEAISHALATTEPTPATASQPNTRAREGPPPALARQPGDAVATGLPLTLTPRQREVATLVAQGRTNRQIGEALVITEGTARVHVEHILAKLGLHSRAQLAGWAVARGLFTPSI
jgi:DNA-binding NarL/FixJ family response regulator